MVLHFDSTALAKAYNVGWTEPRGSGTRNVLTFKVTSRDEVDHIHSHLVSLGYASSQPPYDTFWGARYAIVLDPDGNHVGVMSPSDPTLRRAPPEL